MPGTAGRKLVMDDARARPGRHAPVCGVALPRSYGVRRAAAQPRVVRLVRMAVLVRIPRPAEGKGRKRAFRLAV